ncbi:hypothetical protein GF358_01930 [Candidatus Woesearchaeota archaeon]|nr:hypothetical protein [Candidatus Woesearchaeota archaeon]
MVEITKALIWTIAKWAIVVFIAGFIGQFGKSLTKHLLAKRKRKQSSHFSNPKMEKKRQKAEIKRLKKGR